MNILIVHAHHEPKSFSSALRDRAVATFVRQGHTVEVSDLYAMKFDPVSDRRNFATVKDPEFLKQQQEELYATEKNGFAADIAAEMEKVLRCDLMIFNFPLWWFGLPAILKGWVDRVFAMGKMYGGPLLFENGIGKGKRALVCMTVGGPANMYDGYGLNVPLKHLLLPIQQGIFWFNGFAPLPPFVVHGPARKTEEERKGSLAEYENYLSHLDRLTPLIFPSTGQMESRSPTDRYSTGTDRYGRWMVEIRYLKQPDEIYRQTIKAEVARLAEMERDGKLLFSSIARLDDPDWTGWLLIREESREKVEALLETLPLRAYLQFKIHEALRPQLASKQERN